MKRSCVDAKRDQVDIRDSKCAELFGLGFTGNEGGVAGAQEGTDAEPNWTKGSIDGAFRKKTRKKTQRSDAQVGVDEVGVPEERAGSEGVAR